MENTMTKLNTKSNEVLINDLLLENFDYGEVEGIETKKKYSGAPSNDTDTGQDNPYWNLSILLRIGSYCATAQRQLAKAHERADVLEKKIEQSPTDNLMNAMEQNMSAIVNCEKEYMMFRDFFEDTYGSDWMGEEAYKKQLDEAFSPKTLGNSSSYSRTERAESLMLKNRARKTGRSVSEQETFEHNVDQALAKNKHIKLHKDICIMPMDKGQDLLNKAINSFVDEQAQKSA
jgi:hypothetical protein